MGRRIGGPVVGEHVSEKGSLSKVTFEQRCERSKGGNHEGKGFQISGTAGAKALRLVHTCCFPGVAPKAWLEWIEREEEQRRDGGHNQVASTSTFTQSEMESHRRIWGKGRI